jgi:hypothetical protein
MIDKKKEKKETLENKVSLSLREFSVKLKFFSD